MSTFFASVLSYLLVYKYALIAGMVFASGFVPVPVAYLLVAAGAFASQGDLNLTFSLTSATLANVAGDFIVYLLVRTYGSKVLHFFKVDRTKSTKHLEGYVRDYAAITIFLTRFIGGLDIATTVLCALSGVSAAFFLTFDLFGNAVDTAFLLLLGYFFGDYWQTISNALGVVWWVLFAAALAAFALSYAHYRRRHRG